jgi:diaminopimelate decarboxylase/aspartate kinase
MWQEVGFLADLFAVFKTHGLSIDLVSTSETNVTVSIDPLNNALLPSALEALVRDLSQFGKVKHLAPCAAVSLVGRNIRSILHQLGPALRVFEEQKVYLVSQAASDLNVTFVVQEDEATRLVQELHHLLFDQVGSDPAFGASWQDTFEGKAPAILRAIWWQDKASTLLQLAHQKSPLYVYDAATLEGSAQALKSLRAVDQIFYAMKANNNADVLKTFYHFGLGFECVSVSEIDCVFDLFAGIDPKRVLFTPNFASKPEYVEAFRRKCHVTLDNLYPLEQWPELFAGQEIFLRLDPGQGLGHHKHVRTAGEQSKFGISQNQIPHAAALIERCETLVVGLHAHAGSGITKPSHWVEMADFLMSAAQYFPRAEVLNLGGGLFVPSDIHDDALDLAEFDEALMRLKEAQPKFQFWLEPGRFLVANAGVLLTRVTQLKEKGDTYFIGVDTGMNSLIRPTLYGAHHHIVNLSRLNDPVDFTAHVVGPICESGDTLGYDRKLPKTLEGDVLLIATAGAYGRVMSSRYNLREPADEYFLSE